MGLHSDSFLLSSLVHPGKIRNYWFHGQVVIDKKEHSSVLYSIWDAFIVEISEANTFRQTTDVSMRDRFCEVLKLCNICATRAVV